MKLEYPSLNLTMQSDEEPTSFSIATSREAFLTLSSRLYPDKIKAVIRELTTNAVDSHVMAGKKDTPVLIHLPNALEPHFSVKDFGLGLSHQDVKTLYTTYFDSNKRDSDETTGCLGLGSKSPLAYVDNFLVSSRFDGVHSFYNCFVSKKGLPNIVRMGEKPTDECNGMEITVAVKESDMVEFKQKTQDVYRWFSYPLEVVGEGRFKVKPEDYLTQTADFAVCKKNRGNSYVVMGNVAYKIDVSKLLWSDFDSISRNVLGWGVDFFVPIGSVRFTADREQLEYIPQTIETIRVRVQAAIDSIKAEVQKQLEMQPNIWEARKFLYNVHQNVLGQVALKGIFYKGEVCRYVINQDDFENAPAFSKLVLRKERFRKDQVDKIHPEDDTIVFVNDVPHGGTTRITNYLHDNNKDGAYLFDLPTTPAAGAAFDSFMEKSGLIHIIKKASDLPKTVRAARTSLGGARTVRATLMEFVPTNPSEASNYWREADVELTAGGFYVVVAYNKVKQFPRMRDIYEDSMHPEYFTKVYRLLVSFGMCENVYGVRPMDVEKLKKSGTWVSVWDYMDKLVKDEEYLNKLQEAINFRSLQTIKAEAFNDMVMPDSEFGKFIESCRPGIKANNDETIQRFQDLLSKTAYLPPPQTALRDKEIELCEKYPMFKLVNWCKYAKFGDGILDYVNKTDTLNGSAVQANMDKFPLLNYINGDIYRGGSVPQVVNYIINQK